MKKVLIAVDETKGSMTTLSVFRSIVKSPEEVVLLHVEKPGGKSLMYDMLGEAEMKTLRESMQQTPYKDALDRKADRLLTYYREALDGNGAYSVKTVVREGHPVEEILKVAQEEKVDLIVMGCNGKKGLNRLITGCTTKDVERNALVPVLVAKTAACEKAYEKSLSWRHAYDAR